MVSDVIKILVNKKLLRREPHEKDRRAHSLTLTSKGKNLILKAVPVVEAIDKDFFCAKNAELIQLNKVLSMRLKN